MPQDRTPVLDAVLREVVEGVEAETGERFFQSLVRHLSGALGVDYAFVSELTCGGARFRTRALWGRGAYLENLEVPVQGTPCQAVLDGEISHHAHHLCERFPEDAGLRDWGVVSYCGVPLTTSDGEVVGHFAIFDSNPMPDASLGIAVMRIFAARATAELDRLRAEQALRVSEERLSRVLDSAMDAIITFDAERRVELFNGAAETMFGREASAMIGSALDPCLGPRLASVLEEACAADGGGLEAPRLYLAAAQGLTAVRSDGRAFAIEATLSHAVVGGRALYTLILRDVDVLKQAEAELTRVSRHKDYLEEELKSVHAFDDIVGRSRAIASALEDVDLVAGTGSSVLILGETGTGKELIARAVHAASQRKSRPFVKVNCAALPAGLIESELFGHERGAFTGATQRRIGRFELADSGTLFLDEIGDMPLEVQAKLLRVLQEQQFERVGGHATLGVDVRVIAATNRDLARDVEKGTFRADLYYRLNVFPIWVPPLRQRREDIPLLGHYFLNRYAAKIGRKGLRIPEETIERLLAYDWPGNVRELENVIERAVILAGGGDTDLRAELLGIPSRDLQDADETGSGPIASRAAGHTIGGLPPMTDRNRAGLAAADDPVRAAGAGPGAASRDRGAPHGVSRAPGTGRDGTQRVSPQPAAGDSRLETLERRHIETALQRSGWRIEGPSGAARSLGINPSTLRSRMKKLGIRRDSVPR